MNKPPAPLADMRVPVPSYRVVQIYTMALEKFEAMSPLFARVRDAEARANEKLDQKFEAELQACKTDSERAYLAVLGPERFPPPDINTLRQGLRDRLSVAEDAALVCAGNLQLSGAEASDLARWADGRTLAKFTAHLETFLSYYENT